MKYLIFAQSLLKALCWTTFPELLLLFLYSASCCALPLIRALNLWINLSSLFLCIFSLITTLHWLILLYVLCNRVIELAPLALWLFLLCALFPFL